MILLCACSAGSAAAAGQTCRHLHGLDPTAGAFATLPPSATPPIAIDGAISATRPDGGVLIAGGSTLTPIGFPVTLASAEIFDPATATFAWTR